MTVTHEHVCEGNWAARSHAVFWEPGAEEWARKKLWLPDGVPVDAAMLGSLKVAPHTVVDGPVPGNQLTSAGLGQLFIQLINGSRAWSVTSTTGFTGLAVGNGTTADAVGNTDLSGASKAFRVCDDTYPLRLGSTHPITSVALTAGQILFAVTYLSGEANFAWDEYAALIPAGGAPAVAVATAAAASRAAFGGGNYTLLNRKSPAGLGTKATGAPATLYLLVTIV